MRLLTNVFLNCDRNMIRSLPPPCQKVEAARAAKMFLLPKNPGRGVFDNEIPDNLVTEEMAERYLEITPPTVSLIPEYQEIINEIEKSYVTGNDFSSLAASCVVIERLLNEARIKLHKHHHGDRKLEKKGPTNTWGPNIKALEHWGYLDAALAAELHAVYGGIRCRYLHSQPIQDLRGDALRAIKAAYRLMAVFIGFPEDLFVLSGGAIKCKNENDPRFLEFYRPFWR
jgi:hypothetical protein